MILIVFLLLVAPSNALEVTTAVHCNGQIGAKDPAWCLDGEFQAGRQVSFLERKNCQAKTGEPQSVSNEIGEMMGTSLKELSCATAKDNDKVILDAKVQSYSKLELKPVSKEHIPADLNKRLRSHPMFKVMATRGPDQAQMPPAEFELRLTEIIRPGIKGKTYLATYTEEGEVPFLVTPSTISALSTSGGSGAGANEAFRLNGRDFLVVGLFQLGTDGGGTNYVEMGK